MSGLTQELAEKIVNGQVQLLGIDEIVSRLQVSRSTVERWVRKGKENLASKKTPDTLDCIPLSVVLGNKMGAANFPPPDIYIGSSPKWMKSTVVAWLMANSTR